MRTILRELGMSTARAVSTPVTMAVRIEGKIPESGQLIMTAAEPGNDDPRQEETVQMLPLKISHDEQGDPILKAEIPLKEKGKYRY